MPNSTHKLKLLQENAAVGHYGDGGLYSFTVDLHAIPDTGAKIDEKGVVHTFEAPAGWGWNKYAAYYYYNSKKQQVVGSGTIDPGTIKIEGKKLTFTRDVLLNSDENHGEFLCYNLALVPQDGAEEGTQHDGTAMLTDAKGAELAKKIFLYAIIDGS
ncbi:hypothetical protein [Streptomyces sp. NPDC001787]|uniref:hypothetical protein n=1 Tax=Streptomyces sp. NPDC001787 TaxID=3154523 RepID=UPI00331E2616